MKFTILGSHGFVGRNLADFLAAKGHEVRQVCRQTEEGLVGDLGHVIYCIGLTADFRSRPFDTVEAHVCKLARLLLSTKYESWLYFSSTRVYEERCLEGNASETLPLLVRPGLDGIYNLSKLLGESLCLAIPNEKIRIVRLSNVFGVGQNPSTFLASVIREILNTGQVTIKESSESNKDYVSLEDAMPMIEQIALTGKERLYNLASGNLISHLQLAEALASATKGKVFFEPGGPIRKFPLIDVSRIFHEFGFASSDFSSLLTDLVNKLRKEREK